MGRGDRSSRSSRSTASTSQGSRRDRHRSKSPRDKDKSKDSKDKSRRSRSRSPRDRKDERRAEDDEKRRRPNEPPSRPLGRREKEELDLGEIVRMADKDEAEKKLEIEMQKRRERIEMWRKERSKPGQPAPSMKQEESSPDGNESHKRGWTLEDEDDDDLEDSAAETNGKQASVKGVKEELEDLEDMEESDDMPAMPKRPEPVDDALPSLKRPAAIVDEPKGSPKEEKKEPMETAESTSEADAEEVDPLDAFMRKINTEIRGVRPGAAAKGKARVVVVNTVATKSNPLKGDIIEPEEEQEAYNDEFDLEQAAATLLSKGRQLALTDHNKVYYRPFRKNFYVEVPELARMTEDEVEKYREELESIKVRGKNCPKPIKTWAQCGVELKMLDVLKKNNYTKPTPIQAQAIPAIMSGRDVIGIAKTGSGKTLAFLLPMFRHIMDQEELDELDGPIAMILSPTRELAMQTWKEAKKFARILNLRAVCVYGGAGISEQIADLKRGAEIVVCTPGRLIDMLAANNGKVTNLRRVTYLVLDEADRMFDMGFEPQVMKIINNVRPDRQSVLFSATFPRQMEALARKVLVKPIEIQVGAKSVVCKDVTQNAVICEEHQKFLKLLELLGVYWECGNVLVFVEKQEKADELVGDLMKHGYNCAPLHGGIDQFDRDSTINDFKSAKIKLLVATSVAARGLDVKKLILVVNYDCPNHYEDYVHRVGRTGRAGNKGYAYTFILNEGQEQLAGDVYRAFESAGQEPPDDLKEMWETFQANMKAEGKTVKHGGGFSGHGFKFDEAEDEAEATKRKMTKLVHGLEAGVEDDDDEIENQITSIMKSKTRVVEAKKGSQGPTTHANLGALEKAKMLAQKISQDKNLTGVVERDAASRTAEAVMRGGEAAPVTISAKAVAQQLAEQLNEKLNYIPSELHPGVDTEQDVQYFEEELEINDFPQQVRWRVCSRECIGQVQEYADVGISVKGSFYPPNKEPKDDDRKLFLFIEARSELALTRAKTEVIRIMKDSLRQLASQARTGGQQARYKVV